jgi:hypothetical protein
MSKIKVLGVDYVRPTDFLLRPAETKFRGLIAITNIDCIKDKAVY